MTMRLNNPPVVESWIGFQFEPRPNSLQFPRSAQALLANRTEDFPEAEFEIEQEVTMQGASAQEAPKPVSFKAEITRVRSFNKAKTRCLQFEKDHLIYSAIKTDQPYPAFEVLCEEAFQVLDEYERLTDPASIRSAAIFYKDILSIPAPGKRIESIAEHFIGAWDFPPVPFGDTVFFRHQHVFECPVDKGRLVHALQPFPGVPGEEKIRFEATWLKVCEDLNTLDRKLITDRLTISHDYVLKCFRSFVTEKTWQLFEPEGD